MGSESRKFLWGSLALLVGLGGWLRLKDLTHQGLYTSDEVQFVLHSKTYVDLGRWILHNPRRFLNRDTRGLREELRRGGGAIPYTSGRPTHAALAGIFYLLCGGRDYSILAMSAVCGVLSVLLIFLCGLRWGGCAGITGAGLLAVMGGHVWYSRLGLATTNTGLMALLGFGLLLRDWDRKGGSFLPAGVAWGLTFTTHDNSIFGLGLTVLFILWDRPNRFWGFVKGFLSVPIGWEVLFQIRNAFSPEPLPSLFVELMMHIGSAGMRHAWEIDWAQSRIPFIWLVATCGIPYVIALGAGLIFALVAGGWRKSILEQLAWALGVGVFVAWSLSLSRLPVARVVGSSLPFLCLVSGLGWVRGLNWVRGRYGTGGRWGLASLFLICLGCGAVQAAQYQEVRSPYPRVAAFLREHPGRWISTCDLVLEMYIPEGRFRYVNADWKADRLLPENMEGLRFVVLDQLVHYAYDRKPVWLEPTLRRGPILRVPYGIPDPRLLIFEHNLGFFQSRLPIWGWDLAREVQVYEFGSGAEDRHE